MDRLNSRTQNPPQWTLKDAFESSTSSKFRLELARLKTLIAAIDGSARLAKEVESIRIVLSLYEQSLASLHTLNAFLRCETSIDALKDAPLKKQAEVNSIGSKLDSAIAPVISFLRSLSDDDPIWEDEEIQEWYVYLKSLPHFNDKLNEDSRSVISQFQYQINLHVRQSFHLLNKGMRLRVKNLDGFDQVQGYMKSIGVLKGEEDEELRRTTFDAMNMFYNEHGSMYAQLLNLLAGFRITSYNDSGNSEVLSYSLQQNRISREAVEQMLSCCENRISDIRRTISLRSKAVGSKLKVYNLYSPAPLSPSLINKKTNFYDSIQNIKEAGKNISDTFPDFVDLMIEKKWIEARFSSVKAGGAFYVFLKTLKQPRIFSTYFNNLSSEYQLALMLGHAWHAWQLKDYPEHRSLIPMSLTEVAGILMGEQLLSFLLNKSESQEDKFYFLWQQMKYATNYLLNIPVRFEFEKNLLSSKKRGNLTALDLNKSMEKSWEKWYGDEVDGCDRFLWAYKQHFYKPDQFFYNYPYAVGYLTAQGFSNILSETPDRFKSIYPKFLLDCGSQSFDECIQKYFKLSPQRPDFWNWCLDNVVKKINSFEELLSSEHSKRN
ncbi:hypothetical protein [Turicimonas muris]|uniref:hypothetical protein n=1 Tax=Turicimonas muris TaxID=1796652 RepID=UPI0026EEA037|nr:hypothetical protein [Turicimonas muris]